MSRRLKRLSVSRKHFTSFLTPGPKAYEIIEDGLPADAVVVGVEMSFPSDAIVFWVQSDQFDDVPDCDRIPEIAPILTQLKSEQTAKANVGESRGEQALFTTRHDFTETYRAGVDNYHELARGFCENPDHRFIAGYRAIAVDVKPFFSTTFEAIASVNIEVTYRHVTNIAKPKAAN